MRLITFFILVSTTCLAQVNSTIGTSAILSHYNQVMDLTEASDSQIDSILLLTNNYEVVNGDSCLLLAQKVVDLAKNKSNQLLHAKALLGLGEAYRLTGNGKEGKKVLREAISLGTKIDEKSVIAEANDILGVTFKNEGDAEKALKYSIISAQAWEQLGEQSKEAYAYLNISDMFFNNDQLSKSIEYSEKAKTLAKAIGDNNLLINISGFDAINLMTYGIHYYLKNEKDTANIQMTMDTLNYYFEASEKKYDETLQLAKGINSKRLIVSTLNNMVALKLNMEKYDEALQLAIEAERIANEIQITDLLIQSQFNLASTYRRFGKYKEAIVIAKNSVLLAQKHKLERKEFLANRVLYDLYEATGDYKNANIILNELRTYDNRVGAIESKKAIAKIEAEFQNVKKQKEILELKAKNKRIARQRNLIIGSILLFGIFLFSMFRFNKIRQERNDKKAFAEALIFAQEEERKRIARDLHDGIGQSLLLLKKEMIATHQVTLDNQTMISDTLDEVRSISRDLHPLQLEKFGLTAAIEDTIFKMEKSTGLFITTEIENIDNSFENATNIHVYRAVQEALSNIIKHAEATATKVIITKNETECIITILDNGKGFDHELAIVKSKSLGLKTMNERLSAIKGTFKMTSNEPNGTKIVFIVPLKVV